MMSKKNITLHNKEHALKVLDKLSKNIESEHPLQDFTTPEFIKLERDFVDTFWERLKPKIIHQIQPLDEAGEIPEVKYRFGMGNDAENIIVDERFLSMVIDSSATWLNNYVKNQEDDNLVVLYNPKIIIEHMPWVYRWASWRIGCTFYLIDTS